eukprot:gene13608-biopygen11539
MAFEPKLIVHEPIGICTVVGTPTANADVLTEKTCVRLLTC